MDSLVSSVWNHRAYCSCSTLGDLGPGMPLKTSPKDREFRRIVLSQLYPEFVVGPQFSYIESKGLKLMVP